MIRFITAVILFCVAVSSATILPDERRIEWVPGETVGVSDGIPTFSMVFCNVQTNIPGTNILAVGDGDTDDYIAMQTAISLCPSGQVVYVPDGTYRLTNALSWSKSIVLRGAGTNTVLRGYNSGGGASTINIGGWLSLTTTDISSGYTKGSSNITVASASGFAVGKMLLLDQLNDGTLASQVGSSASCTWCSRASGTRVMQQLAEITGVSGTDITFWPPLFWTYAATNSPQASVATPAAQWTGLENFKTEDHGAAGGSQRQSIVVGGAKNFWMNGIVSSNCYNGHFVGNQLLFYEIRRCHLYDAIEYIQNRGYGIELGRACTAGLIEDNILGRMVTQVVLEWGASGNVVAYNFFAPVRFDAAPDANTPNLVNSHGAHPMMNLFEGNICAKFQSDWFFGSASHGTAFRNYFYGYEPGFTNAMRCVDLHRQQTYFNLIGNVLGASGHSWVYQLAWPTNGNYDDLTVYRFGFTGISTSTNDGAADAFDTVLLHGNYDYSTESTIWNDGIEDHVLPDSYYLTEKPSFFGAMTWPPMDGSTGTTNTIPAEARYLDEPVPEEEPQSAGSRFLGTVVVGTMRVTQ